jgi:hypothetical protein
MTWVAMAERSAAAFNGLLAALWLASTRGPLAAALVAAHTGAAALPWLFASAPPRRLTGLVRELYPLLLVAAVWFEMDLLQQARDPRLNDAAVLSLELKLFGTHPSLLWMPAMPAVWFSEIMQAVYFFYYFAAFGTPLALLLAGCRDAARETILRLTVSAIGCYVAFLLFPVNGPRFTQIPYGGPLTEGFFYGLNFAAHASGDAVGTAFPSSHVANVVTIAIAAIRRCPRWAAVLLTAEAIGTCLAVVYTQSHYTLDAVAGLALALTLQLAVVPVALRLQQGALRLLPAPLRTPAPEPVTTGGGFK